jgi:methionyl-tRNA formyltransferase
MPSVALPTVVFFAMTKKGLTALQAFVAQFGPQAVECVVGARDQATQEDYFAEIRDFCLTQNIRLAERQNPGAFTSKHAFAIGWRWLIGEEGFQLIVFHDSILPRYRGFAPLVNGLIKGESELGVTALCAAEEYDRGAILAQAKFTAKYPLKIAAAIEEASALYAQLAINIYEQILRGDPLTGTVQDENKATYSLWRDADDYLIDWNQDAAAILRLIDAVGYPYLGAATRVENKFLRILEAELLPDVVVELRQPGKVLSLDERGNPVIVCGKGLLKITSAINDETRESILPLKRFRVRFH